MAAYTSKLNTLPTSGSYTTGDTLTLADGTVWRYQKATGWTCVSRIAESGAAQLPYLQKANWCFMDTTNPAFAGNFTQHAQMTLEAPFVAVQIGVANGYTTGGTQTVKVAVSAMSAAGVANSTDPLNPTGAWLPAGNGGASLAIPAATVAVNSPGFAWGDIVPLASLARSDGGTFPLLCVRVQNPAGNNLTGVVGATNAGTPFESETGTAAKGRLYRVRSQVTLGVDDTTLAAMNTAVADQSYGPAIIVRYFLADGTGRTVTVFGDSLDCGYGQQAVGTSSWTWIREAAALKSTPSAPVEVCCLANSGFSLASVAQRAATFAQHCKGTAVIVPNGSPNSIGPGAMAKSTMDPVAAQFAALYKTLTDQGISPMVRTFLPTTTASRGWGASDSLRIAANAKRVANAQPGSVVLDVASLAAGATDATGQQQLVGGESDGIHPTAAFASIAAPLLTAVL